MWTFAPTLALPSGHLALPRPIVQLRVQDHHDQRAFKVPLQDGSRLHGRSRGGVDIAIRGQFAKLADQQALSEAAMLDAIDAVRTALHLDGPEQTYGLGLFRSDAEPTELRGFRDCTTTKFEYDLSDHALYGYSLLVHASDPNLAIGSLLPITS